jgi:Fe-S cluster assembly iron-binding protein IscA
VISVTEHAKQVLKSILIDIEADPDEGLRLLPSPKGEFVLARDIPQSGDQVVEHEGLKVLLIGVEYYNFLNGKTVDCEETEDGEVLLVR